MVYRWVVTTLLYCVIILTHAAERSAGPPPLRVGLLPYLSTEKLLERFAPLKTYLEINLHRPVILETAPSFSSYVERAEHYQYDLYLTAPHIAALVETDFHYRRISRLTRELDGSIVVRKDGPIKTLQDLKGRIFIAPSDTAITTMLGEQLLRDNQLIAGKNITVQYTPSHNNAIMAVASGKADAAVTSAAVFETMPVEVRDKLRILTTTPKVPHMMFMASPKLKDGDYQQLRRSMLRFTAAGAGRTFFENSGYGDMGEITNREMRTLRPYVKLLRQRLQVERAQEQNQSSP
ncbi:MAG: phosphate/phosphite/phosphonate ABC transporter substrate-binding protein [Gammaproteobacteria bacterium]|nr:phosphate/phosphite/phosphonate ABC transporter substrate-binding protein [Gammaproteobacteria bacterium]